MITLRHPLRVAAVRREHVLGAAVLLVGALAVWPWLVPPLPATRPVAPRAAQAAAPALAPLPPMTTYAAIVERPLFSSSRRPTPGAGGVPGPSVESRYRLLGIVATGVRKTAFVAEGARRLEIAEGDTLDGWTVKTIGQDRVLLASPAGEAALKLKLAPPEPPSPAPAAQNPAGPKPQ